MLRSLRYYWRINLAVVLGAAVTTSVLVGALLVGSSVRESLRHLTLDRLGRIDDALISQRFFPADLADRLTESGDFQSSYVAAVSIISQRASLVHPESRSRASRVQLHGVGESFGRLFARDLKLEGREGDPFQAVVINEPLRRQLGATFGDQILVNLERASEIHRESLLGDRDLESQLRTIRLTVVDVLPAVGVGRFSLQTGQAAALVAFVDLKVLQQALGEESRVNTILLERRAGSSASSSFDALPNLVRESLHSEDLGLTVVAGEDYFSLQSEEYLLPDAMVELAESVAGDLSLKSTRIFTYLANRIEVSEGITERFVPYSTVAAIPSDGNIPPGLFRADGSEVAPPRPGEVVLNEWSAAQLRASVGQDIRLEYYTVGPRNELITHDATFRLSDVVALEGLGSDRTLTPAVEGIHDQENISSWDPPFPVHLEWIRPPDENYWDEYGATPKAFVSLEDGVRLWDSRFGSTTVLRVDLSGTDKTAESFMEGLVRRVELTQAGFTIEAVKASGLAGASGPTDFSALFISFSFFLIISSALIAGLLFRLGVEYRVREVGLLLSTGYSARQVTRRFLGEGVVLGSIGALLGLVGGIAYAWFLMLALRTLWLPAVGTTSLRLFLDPVTLLIGCVGALLVITLAIWLGLRKLLKLPMPLLLAGQTATWRKMRRVGRSLVMGAVAVVIAVALMGFAYWSESLGEGAGSGQAATMAFFGVGACLLAAGLFFFSAWCRKSSRAQLGFQGGFTLLQMAARNTARNPGRSALSVTLVACACFMIISVGAFKPVERSGEPERESGDGGFSLVAESDLPILQDLGSEDGRLDLGFNSSDSEILEPFDIFPLRLLPGDDTSCLNLYRAQKPRLLGVPGNLRERGGFVVGTEEGRTSPWDLLTQDLGPGVIPAFGDSESVMWILQLGMGDDVVLEDEQGRELRLRLVGLIQASIFQSELLISEENFLRYFPSRSGYSYFLVEGPSEEASKAGSALERQLEYFGLDVVSTSQKLAGFEAVRATYISTFQFLGALGLLLGTVGLGVILIRNVVERRGELATLRAFGFRRLTLAGMVVFENGFLLVLGLLIGGISALAAIAPALKTGGGGIPWLSLLVTLALVVIVGMLACLVAVRIALRIPMLPALKAE